MSLSDDSSVQYLPIDIYSTSQIREFEQAAINDYQIPEIKLMQSAGEAIFAHIEAVYANVNDLFVFCGPGNNGGDGYYVAKLAQDAGIETTAFYIAPPENLTGAARWAYEAAKKAEVSILPFDEQVPDVTDLIIDALFGIGLTREIEGEFLNAVHWINQSSVPVLAVDIPSGICSDTGAILGDAVYADTTMTFIGLKPGLLTGEATSYVGELNWSDLALPTDIFLHAKPFAIRLNQDMLDDYLPPRLKNSHKNDFGHVVILGGDYGMAGAVSMAANAALRVGAGLVTVVTRSAHIPAIVGFRPEVMAIGYEHADLETLLASASVVVIGPGLGRAQWGKDLFITAIKSDKPLVIDADGLYFLKKYPVDKPMILTPHPGEAGQLLDITSQQVQGDRFDALRALKKQYPHAHIVLKGAGSLILEDDGIYSICPYGNPGMATAGMGDMLTGIIAGLIAQNHELFLTLELGVLLHAMAGDIVALIQGERGMIASDLLAVLPRLVNADMSENEEALLEEFTDENISD